MEDVKLISAVTVDVSDGVKEEEEELVVGWKGLDSS
jgi:hypothetical protein